MRKIWKTRVLTAQKKSTFWMSGSLLISSAFGRFFLQMMAVRSLWLTRPQSLRTRCLSLAHYTFITFIFVREENIKICNWLFVTQILSKYREISQIYKILWDTITCFRSQYTWPARWGGGVLLHVFHMLFKSLFL